MLDEFYKLAHTYAQACDSRNAEQLISVFTSEGEIESPYGLQKGHEKIAENTVLLKAMFQSTQHRVHNLTVDIDGDTASGETYGTAAHLKVLNDGSLEVEEWSIRYQDKYVNTPQGWLYTRRELIVDWIEERKAKQLVVDPIV